MGQNNRLTMQDFLQYAENNIGHGYETLANTDLYKFKVKAFMDQYRCRDEHHMILVGSYFFRGGRQDVWARATGLEIKYYHGFDDGFELSPIEDMFINRIYYHAPFCYIAGLQDAPMNKNRRLGVNAVEAVINFTFLKRGWLIHIDNENITDVLGAFKHACEVYEPRKQAAEDEAKIKQEKIDENERAQSRAWGRRQDQWPGGAPSPYDDDHDDWHGGTSFPDVKSEPTDECVDFSLLPTAPSSSGRARTRPRTSHYAMSPPALLRSPIRRTPASFTPRRRHRGSGTRAHYNTEETRMLDQVHAAELALAQERSQRQEAEEKIRELQGLINALAQ